jgi:AbrB family looped-hinge helix DNA binding protein
MVELHAATVKVIKDGRVTIPQEIRELESIKEGDFLKITIEKIERSKQVG